MIETTRETSFRGIPTEQCDLLFVANGVCVTTALREADDLESAVRHILELGVETGVDGTVSFLCVFAMEAANALRKACASEL